jgi:hypothetical protein
MSLIDSKISFSKQGVPTDAISAYKPSEDEAKALGMIRKHFSEGDLIMKKPRREFNDLSVLQRMDVDQMAFNTYQPNNGEALDSDETQSWKSRAMRPIQRNKCISIAAHATARLIFPKVFAVDKDSNEQEKAGIVMEDIMEWAGERSNYAYLSLKATLTALWSPASIVYTEYAEVYRTIKESKEGKKWKKKEILDDILSGFQDEVVPVDELYIADFYEHDIQKQRNLIRRKIQDYSLLEAKYKDYPNFKHVKPGVQVLFNDANQTFYEVYDTNMRHNEGEEVIYWHRTLDLKLIVVNGILLTDADNPNPRLDKMYPFEKFGYELLDEGKCFYYKSVVFKMQQDANIINTLYPMIIDGTYLSLMPPMIARGTETIGSDVVIPGATTTLSSPDARLEALQVGQNMTAGMNTLFKVNESLEESSQEPLMPYNGKRQTAYEMSLRDRERQTILGLFIQMISEHVKGFGKLRMGDIIQYLTIADVNNIEDNAELIYKTFLLPNKGGSNKSRTRKIKFTNDLPEGAMTKKDELALSYKVLDEQGGIDSKTELYKVNPERFRELQYSLFISPDVINPMSEDLERQFSLEEYDRAIQNPILDQEEVTKDFLLGAYPKSRKDPDKYIKQQQPVMQPPLQAGQGEGNNPLQAMLGAKAAMAPNQSRV